MGRLELRGVGKVFPGGLVAAEQVDLDVEAGELFVILGPSGSGKSTLLRLVAGLEGFDSGSIHLDGRRIDGLSPVERGVAMVFQDQVLYPHLDAFENVAFGLRARGLAKADVAGRVEVAAAALGLSDCLDRRPETLSGGQRRRVALARALVLRPALYLLDEPFSGLDAPLRASTRAELADLNRKLGATMILVTHDQGEALALGDRMAVMNRGRIVQVGKPLALYDRPGGRFVARFLGHPPMNLLPGLASKEGAGVSIRLVHLDEGPPWSCPADAPWTLALASRDSPRVELGLRPEHLRVRNPGSPRPVPSLPEVHGTIRRVEPQGHETLAYLSIGPHEVAARLSPTSALRAGDRVVVGLDLARASWFDASTGDRLG